MAWERLASSVAGSVAGIAVDDASFEKDLEPFADNDWGPSVNPGFDFDITSRTVGTGGLSSLQDSCDLGIPAAVGILHLLEGSCSRHCLLDHSASSQLDLEEVVLGEGCTCRTVVDCGLGSLQGCTRVGKQVGSSGLAVACASSLVNLLCLMVMTLLPIPVTDDKS